MKAETHINDAKPGSLPNDPLYAKEWYIVSNWFLSFPESLLLLFIVISVY